MQPLMYPKDFLWSFVTMPIKMFVNIVSIYLVLQVTVGGNIGNMIFAQLVFVGSWSMIIWYLVGITPLGGGVIGYQITSGILDKFLLKPLPLVYMCTFQKFYVQKIVEILLQVGICTYILFHGYIFLSPIQWVQVCFVILSSITLVISIFYCAEALYFFFPNSTVTEYFIEHASSIAKYPSDLYPTFFRTLFTFFVPAFLITNPLFEIFAHRYTWSLFFVTILLVSFWVVLSIVLWKKGVTQYQSAN